MRILVVISSLTGGGAGRVVSTLTLEWARSHHVMVALFDASDPAYDYGGRITDLRTPSRRSNPLKRIQNAVLRTIRIARILRRERPDRIISFMESSNFPTIVASLIAGSLGRLTVSVRCNPAMIPLFQRILIPVVYRLAGRVIAPSNGVRDALRKMGLPPQKLSVIPNPVADRTPLPGSIRFGEAQRYILGAGRLETEKGFDRLLKAFSKIDRLDVQLVILGVGTQRAGLLKLAHELGIVSRVHLPGVVSDVDTWYRHADCFVLTSHCEGFPNVLVEAMANGCPVVSFDCPYGPAEILEDGRNGMLVRQDDIAKLSETIQRLLVDRKLHARLAKVGRQRATAFSVEKISRRWLSAFGAVR